MPSLHVRRSFQAEMLKESVRLNLATDPSDRSNWQPLLRVKDVNDVIGSKDSRGSDSSSGTIRFGLKPV